MGGGNTYDHRHYVVGKDTVNNIVYVCKGAHHPALFCDYLVCSEFTWIAGEPPPLLLERGMLKCHYKVRYRLNWGSCTVRLIGTREFDELPKTKFFVEMISKRTSSSSSSSSTSSSSSSSPQHSEHSHFRFNPQSLVLVQFDHPQRCVTPGQYVTLILSPIAKIANHYH
jgi:tRNA U34 2-thiouridine synthase MnmA/TrmU